MSAKNTGVRSAKSEATKNAAAKNPQPQRTEAASAPTVTRRRKEQSERPESVVTVQVKTPHPVPPREDPREKRARRISREEREKRRWVADTIRDLLFAILGGVISFLVSLLLLGL